MEMWELGRGAGDGGWVLEQNPPQVRGQAEYSHSTAPDPGGGVCIPPPRQPLPLPPSAPRPLHPPYRRFKLTHKICSKNVFLRNFYFLNCSQIILVGGKQDFVELDMKKLTYLQKSLIVLCSHFMQKLTNQLTNEITYQA